MADKEHLYVVKNISREALVDMAYRAGEQDATKNIRAVWEEWDLTEMLSLHSSRKWKVNTQALNDALIKAIKAEGINAGWIKEK